ncbi:hypothetical protein ACFLZ0_01580 [Patescibacteria group bacterium]
MSDDNSIKSNKQSSLSSNELNIRTMHEDIERLKQNGGQSKTIEPPKNLPTIGLRQKLEQKKDDSIKGVDDIRARLEERPAPPPPPAPSQTDLPIDSKKNRLILYSALIVIIVLLGSGGFLYWWNYIREPVVHYKCENLQCVRIEGEGISQCQINEDCIPPEPTKPNSLIPVEKTEIIEVESYQEDIFLSILQRNVLDQAEKGSLNRILIKKISDQKEKKYASLAEFIFLNNISIPLSLRNYFTGDYTLFVYVPEMEEYYKCQDAGITDFGCYGPRLGLAIKLSDKEKAIEELIKWESTMVNDLEELIFAETSIIDESVGFQSDLNMKYQEAGIRYQNLPISPIAVNYGFVEDLLIISTSKNGLYIPLDKLINMNE